MALDFPAAPTLNQKYPTPAVPGVPTYTWDGQKWTTKSDAIGASAYVAKTGDVMTGPLMIDSVEVENPLAWIGLGGKDGAGVWSYDGVTSTDANLRWGLGLGNNATYDAFTVERYNDAGGFVDFPLTISRASGSTTLKGDLYINNADPALFFSKPVNAPAVIYTYVGANPRWAVVVGDTNPESGADVGCNFIISRYSDTGVWLGAPFFIDRKTGQVLVEAAPTTALGVATKSYVDAGTRQTVGVNIAAYTLVLADAGKVLWGDFGTTAITITIPPNVFPLGTQIEIIQANTGQVTIATGAGVSLMSEGNKRKSYAQYAGMTIIQMAANTWWLGGNITA